MPFYRINGMMVHVKGSKKLPDGCRARVLVDGQPVFCLAPGGWFCDGVDSSKISGTCNRPLCEAHAHEIGPDRHLCPSCRLTPVDSLGQRSIFTSLI